MSTTAWTDQFAPEPIGYSTQTGDPCVDPVAVYGRTVEQPATRQRFTHVMTDPYGIVIAGVRADGVREHFPRSVDLVHGVPWTVTAGMDDAQPIETSDTDARPYVGGTPENIRSGDPYDDPAFERLAREHDVWGRAEGALCAVFWLAGKARPPSGQSAGPAGAPDRIFLVISEDIPPDTPFSQLAEVAWCPDRVNDTDIEYVRAQPAAAPVPAGERGTPDIAEFGELIDDYQCAQKDGSEDKRARARIALMAAYRAALAAPAAPPENDPKALIDAARQAGWTFLRGADGRYTLQPIPPAHAQSAAPQAGEDARPVAFAQAGSLFWHGSPVGWRGFSGDLYLGPQPAAQAAPTVPDDFAREALRLALEYWADRQQRYKNRAPVWVQKARAALTAQGASHGE